MEAISVAIGIAAAKFIVRLWTQDTAAEGLGDDVLSAFGDRIQGPLSQREVKRQLETLADHIAERISPFLSSEIGGISPNELEAAALAAQDSIEMANGLDPNVLLGIDLDSARLAKLIRASDPEAAARAGLSEAASGVYDTLISECASYITSIALQLPGYRTREAQELLGRHSRLAETAREILDHLPVSSVPREWGTGSEDQRFENKYRHAVREYSEQLQLFGVVQAEARRPYPLSVAYISMAVDDHTDEGWSKQKRSAHTSNENLKRKGSDPEEPEAASDILRVETLLADTDRLLLTGGAGSGKTTLIQWIAYSSVTGTTDSSAPQDWTERVPFVVPLRRFVGASLPTPQKFVEQIAPNLAEAMPAAWVHRTLAAGRGTVLIDGLDEIPHSEREEARLWVRQLIRDFPNNKFLVTSRTTAITKGWREEESFRQAELLPMEVGDIRAFIAHWHEATRQAVSQLQHAEIDDAERSLLGIVRDRPTIRALCTSPLLCALVCALHLQNGASLPSNRMDIYRTALEMLVHKRDSDRRLSVAAVEIDFAERQIVLRSFAAWLHENGTADATRSDFNDRVERTLPLLHRVKGSPQDLASFMLERSGVLREPVAGRVDFVHRTFLEYLAAAAIVDDNSIEKLIRSAHDDHWREVIILAAGHANSEQRENLLRGLLQRGIESPRRRHRFFLLAVACMETSPQLPEALRDDLQSALQDVLPPKNMTEASAVASAGELAVPMLQSYVDAGATVAAASVRALSLIGGDSALTALAAYAHDHRVTVTRQLIRAWSSFDTAEYADRVLRDSPLDRGHIRVSDPEQIGQLPKLSHADSIYVSFPRRFASSSDVPMLPDRTYGVDITGLSDINSPLDLPFPRTIRSLSIRNSSLLSLDGIESFEGLRYLSVSGSSMLYDIEALQRCAEVTYMDLSGTAIRELSLGDSMELSWLLLYSARTLEVLAEPIPASELNVSYGASLRDISGIGLSNQLRTLTLGLGKLDKVQLPSGLRSAALNGWGNSVDISGGESLARLDAHVALAPDTLEWVIGLPELRRLALIVRDDEIGGWSPNTAVAEICARSSAASVTVSIPYDRSISLPDPDGWRKIESQWSVRFLREGPESGGEIW